MAGRSIVMVITKIKEGVRNSTAKHAVIDSMDIPRAFGGLWLEAVHPWKTGVSENLHRPIEYTTTCEA